MTAQPPNISGSAGREISAGQLAVLTAGKVTVGLASHRSCITDSVVYPSTGSMGDEHPAFTPARSMTSFILSPLRYGSIA